MKEKTRLPEIGLGIVLTFVFVASSLQLGGGARFPKPALDATALEVKHALTGDEVDGMMKSLSNWGRWGADDQLGTLNLITPKVRKAAAQEVREGVCVSLAANVVKVEKPSSSPFRHKMLSTGSSPNASGASDEYCVAYHGLTQTHVDALCHRFYKGQMYNAVPQQTVTDEGAEKLSIIVMKNGLFTRGVLMDIPRLLGMNYLDGKRAIFPEDLDAWERKAGFKVRSGDALLIRTGSWMRRAKEGDWEPSSGSAGLHASCLPWLKNRDIAIVGSDFALDCFPSQIEGFGLPVHDVVIVGMGMHILDNLDLEAISEATQERHRWTFLLTVAPLAVGGGTGSPINPIATF